MAGKPERGKRKTLRDEMVQFRTDIPGGAGLPPQHHRRMDLQIDPGKFTFAVKTFVSGARDHTGACLPGKAA